MIAPPGSTLWLLGWEIRLSWRALLGNRRSVMRLWVFGLLGLVSLSIGFLIALPLRLVTIPINTTTVVIADAVAAFAFTLMLSQTLAGATDALYTRGDLDLLFSSPLSPRKTLTVRFLAMATTAYASFGLLVAPLLLPAALLGHPGWLALLVVLAALSLAASATGLAVAVGLFALIGPRRTKVVAQVMAALIGAAVFLTTQIRNLLGGRGLHSASQQMLDLAQHARFRYPPLADLPLRAALGEPAPLVIVVAMGVGLFLAVSGWLSRRFAADASAAKGAGVSASRTSRRPIAAFAAGAFAATFRKEMRLLRRDIALMSQVLLRVLYLLPTIFLVLRGAGGAQMVVLPFVAGMLVFMSGQVASSLTWITVSAEDAPELIAASPAAPNSLRSAKLAAGLAPLAVLLALPLVVLTVLAPAVGLATTLGCASCAAAAGMINAWHPVPGKRSEFRRRRSGSVLLGLALMFDSLFIAGATGLFAAGQLWGLIPAAIAALILVPMRRSPAQIADALAANA